MLQAQEMLLQVEDASGFPPALTVPAALTLPEEKRASPSFAHERQNYDGRYDQNPDETHAIASYF
jgi:hypothetical protein